MNYNITCINLMRARIYLFVFSCICLYFLVFSFPMSCPHVPAMRESVSLVLWRIFCRFLLYIVSRFWSGFISSQSSRFGTFIYVRTCDRWIGGWVNCQCPRIKWQAVKSGKKSVSLNFRLWLVSRPALNSSKSVVSYNLIIIMLWSKIAPLHTRHA